MNCEEYRHVYVIVEQRDGLLHPVSLQLLGKGREIADATASKLVAVLVGEHVQSLAQELIFHGADIVYVGESPLLKHYLTENYVQAIYPVLRDHKPNIVLIGATSIGRDLAPRLAAKLNTGLTADCTRLSVTPDGSLYMTRPAFGGNLMATIICPDHRPQMSTVRPGVMHVMPRDEKRQGVIETLSLVFDQSRLKVVVVNVRKEKVNKTKIEDAKVLVSAGRGIPKEKLESLETLAQELKGSVSASRAVVDAGLMDASRQVGQTGKTVRPDVYFALGISGAIQHVAGMEESKLILAVNKDKGAPIFSVADLGFVGDATKIVPAIIDEIRHQKGQ